MTSRACLVVLFAAYVCLSFSPFACAGETVTSRVLGGTTTPATNFPEVVRIRTTGNVDVATGTLISPTHVLTAASPFSDADGITAGFVPANHVCVINGQSLTISSIMKHPNWIGTNGGLHTTGNPDLAILTLNAPVRGVQPAPLYRKAPTVGLSVTLAGFGLTGNGTTGETAASNPTLGNVVTGQTTIEAIATNYYNWVFNTGEADTANGEPGAPSFAIENGIRYVAGTATQRDTGTTGAQHTFGKTTHHTRVDAVIAFIDPVISAGACDLVPVTPFTASNSVRNVPGQKISVSLSVLNQNATNASGPFTVGFFLSTDSTYDTNDIALGTIRVSAGLAGNTTIPLSGTFDLPTGIASGTYFVVAKVDLNIETTQTNYINDSTNGLQVPTLLVVTNVVPTVLSTANASVTNAFTDELIVFSVGAIDDNGDALTYTWNFGDGTSAQGAPVSHAYTAAGTYTVTVTISDPFGGTSTSSVTVVVAAVTKIEFAPSKFKLNFTRLNTDSVSFATRDAVAFSAAEGFDVTIFLGQEVLDTTTIINSRGKGQKGGKFSISGFKTLRYTSTKRDLRATFDRYGASNSDLAVTVPISIVVQVGTARYGSQVPFFYIGKKDKKGQGKF